MLVTNIAASLNLGVELYNDQPGLNGALSTSVSSNLNNLGLDSAYTRVFSASELVTAKVYNGFPSVDLGGSPVLGDDKQPLLLNSIHAVALQVIEIDPDVPGVGYVTITLERVGGASASISTHHLATGDSMILLTPLGWPFHVDTEITIAASTSPALANVNVVFAIVGSAGDTGLGYGYP